MRWILCTLLALLCVPLQAATVRVGTGDELIKAIAQASAGDVIELMPGQYHVNLKIDKALTLQAADPNKRPWIDGGNRGDVIRVTAPDVVLDKLIIANSGAELGEQNAGVYLQPGAHRAIVRDCDFSYTLFGLWIEKADDVTITHNLITGKRDLASSQRGNAIQLYNTQRAKITDNNISFARDGIYVDVSHHALFARNRIHHVRYGTHYMNSYHNTWEDNDVYNNRGGLALMEVRDQIVRRNRAWNNSDHGIMLRTIQDSVIEDNIVAGNTRGFFIYDAEYNTLRNNLIIANNVGIHLSAGSYRNAVDGNDFINNREQIRYVASRDQPWGEKAPNYWSNYSGWDQNGDGRGDIPYEASDAIDQLIWRYPLAKLLINSPAVQTLHKVARQFPLLRSPSIVEEHPAMQPHHSDWSTWMNAKDRKP